MRLEDLVEVGNKQITSKPNRVGCTCRYVRFLALILAQTSVISLLFRSCSASCTPSASQQMKIKDINKLEYKRWAKWLPREYFDR